MRFRETNGKGDFLRHLCLNFSYCRKLWGAEDLMWNLTSNSGTRLPLGRRDLNTEYPQQPTSSRVSKDSMILGWGGLGYVLRLRYQFLSEQTIDDNKLYFFFLCITWYTGTVGPRGSSNYTVDLKDPFLPPHQRKGQISRVLRAQRCYCLYSGRLYLEEFRFELTIAG